VSICCGFVAQLNCRAYIESPQQVLQNVHKIGVWSHVGITVVFSWRKCSFLLLNKASKVLICYLLFII